jgi:hypothetical protein
LNPTASTQLSANPADAYFPLLDDHTQANSSGVAKVTLTLPGAPGPITVTAEGPYALGHPTVMFNETAN